MVDVLREQSAWVLQGRVALQEEAGAEESSFSIAVFASSEAGRLTGFLQEPNGFPDAPFPPGGEFGFSFRS
ncbi:hypothetical protein CP971_34270 [Streptomyces viridifaciens]|nr:hypothetical protein CP971_34270 [Streptomyces viridifaciens]